VDNCASRSISNDKSHLESIGPLDPSNNDHIYDPSGEAAPIIGKGTNKWRIDDGNGVMHTIKLRDSLYVPAFTQCLLCPQHWS
jgi:hypothetical protein